MINIFARFFVIILIMKQYGVDITSRRLDDLDTLLLHDLEEYRNRTGDEVVVLDAGCGEGGLASVLLEAGYSVYGVDVMETEPAIFAGKKYDKGRFHNVDIRDFLAMEQGVTPYTAIVLQRVIHYMPYQTAVTVLKKCLELSEYGVYVSFSGLGSEIAKYYVHKDVSIKNRFTVLSEMGQQTFSITEPLCLYSEDDIQDLITELDCRCEYFRTSAFGNHKCKLVRT